MTNIAKMCKNCKPFQVVAMFVWLCLVISTIAHGFNQSGNEANNAIRCIENERQALVRLRESLIDEAGRLSSWDPSQQDCCLWQGVGCSSTTGHVIILDLSNDNLRGEISPSLLELQHLTYLDLSGNDFSGKLFPNINGSLTLSKLSYLDLEFTELSFTNLYQLGNLSELRFLGLGWNSYRISNLGWLHSLSSLRHLDLSRNNLSDAKDWQQLLNKLPYLENLKLSDCNLPTILSPPSLANSTSSSPLSIDLSANGLTSAVYSLFFNITSRIVDLNLRVNELKGSIPSFFKNMVSLKHLDLASNQLGDEIPEFIGNICTLKTLELSWNYLSNRVVPGLSGCIQNSLEILRLRSNQIQDSLILSHATRFPSLEELDLASNRLNGSFPTGFKHPSELVSLRLSFNQLTGSLPHLANLSSLKYIDISHNRLNGTVTETHFQNLSKLRKLDLSNNFLAFDVSLSWVPPFQLEEISLAFCKMGPHFPKWLQTQKNFERLDISGAGISYRIPDWFWDLPPDLVSLNLSHNQMTMRLPADLSSIKLRTFPEIDLSFNLFEGPLPIFPYNVTSLTLAKNRFSGPVSPLCRINAAALRFLDLSDNMMSGVLPTCFLHWQSLTVLNLANNKFSGGIPITLGSLSSLQTINLHNNSLFGELPSSLNNCTRLKFLDLSQNMFSGSIPVWMGENLSSLIYFSIQANEFNGRIPATLCRLSMLRVLDLSQNNLAGAIPLCLTNLTAMIQKGDTYDIIDHYYRSSSDQYGYFLRNYIDKAWVGWKGRRYLYASSLGLFRIIDLAGNRLVGEIPDEITSLTGLVVLNLSGNNFMGFIPKNIGQLKQLQSLDLSSNHLSGRIPDSIAELNFLSYLNLSYNNLSGQIPTGTQLQTMDASAFAGNQALCGPPTTQQCPKMFQDQQPDARNMKQDRDEFMNRFYAGMGIGFFTAFSGVWGTLLVKPSWRQAYFQLLDRWKDSLYLTFMLLRARLQRRFKS